MRSTPVATVVLLLAAFLHAPRAAEARVKAVQGYDGECACEPRASRCYLTKAAPAGLACKCDIDCTGSVVSCINPLSEWCAHPDTSLNSCVQGGGNCEGYGPNCDCDYKGDSRMLGHSGCVISEPPPSGLACRCIDAWPNHGCYGRLTACPNENDVHCVNPDMSKETCELGGGNCTGY